MKRKQYNIELSDDAEKDFDKSYEYYTSESEHIAEAFYNIVNKGFEKIGQNPMANPKVYKDIRKYLVKKFPFIIYYQVKELIIMVVAIFHTSRNPEIWQKRL
jgi:addiction module RelE/StbE family toxin